MIIKKFEDKKNFIHEKYNNKCCNCGSEENLEMHHILFRDQYPEFEDETDNIMLLCRKCHKEYHGNNRPVHHTKKEGYKIENTMSIAEFRKEMYKWTKKANYGDTVQLTHNGEVVLTIKKEKADD